MIVNIFYGYGYPFRKTRYAFYLSTRYKRLVANQILILQLYMNVSIGYLITDNM